MLLYVGPLLLLTMPFLARYIWKRIERQRLQEEETLKAYQSGNNWKFKD